jgi:hypothetical protein
VNEAGDFPGSGACDRSDALSSISLHLVENGGPGLQRYQIPADQTGMIGRNLLGAKDRVGWILALDGTWGSSDTYTEKTKKLRGRRSLSAGAPPVERSQHTLARNELEYARGLRDEMRCCSNGCLYVVGEIGKVESRHRNVGSMVICSSYDLI